jgi:hypothetical protein
LCARRKSIIGCPYAWSAQVGVRTEAQTWTRNVLPSGAVTVALRSGALGTGCVPGAVEAGGEAEAVGDAVADAVAAGGVTVATGEPASALGAGKSALLPPAGTVPPCPTPWVDVVHAVSVTSAPASAAHRLERMRTA